MIRILVQMLRRMMGKFHLLGQMLGRLSGKWMDDRVCHQKY